MRFLIVDDALFMRNMIKKILTGAGYSDFTEAEDGAKAVNIVENETFDLIFMDWNMPIPGINAVRGIRQLGIETPILMVTTEGEKKRVIEAIQAGANNYLVKPFEASALLEKIDQLIKK